MNVTRNRFTVAPRLLRLRTWIERLRVVRICFVLPAMVLLMLSTQVWGDPPWITPTLLVGALLFVALKLWSMRLAGVVRDLENG